MLAGFFLCLSHPLFPGFQFSIPVVRIRGKATPWNKSALDSTRWHLSIYPWASAVCLNTDNRKLYIDAPPLTNKLFHKRHFAKHSPRVLNEPYFRLCLSNQFKSLLDQLNREFGRRCLWRIVSIPVPTNHSNRESLTRWRSPENVWTIWKLSNLTNITAQVWFKRLLKINGECLDPVCCHNL